MEPSDPLVFRSRRARASLTSLADRDVLVIDLLDGVSFAALRTGRASESTWTGKTPEDPDSSVHLVLQGGVLVGSVRLHRALYRIRPTQDPSDAPDEVVVEHVDESRFPACAVEQRHEIASAGHAASSISPNGQVAATTATQIDVLVVYTPQARVAAGGQAAIEALIDLAVLESNTIYANSQASLELRLVHRAEVAHTESGNFTTELMRLQSPTDGFLDTVHALRNTYGADVVSLIVNQSSSCGVGYVMTNATSSFQGYAFNVVARSCATGYYSFAHELGHNFGCAHDRATGGTGLFPYSHGYHNPAQTWRTVMAYPPGVRIPFFSNPTVQYQGQPTGVVSTAPLGCDNAKTMSLSAPVIAAFRGTVATSASEYGLGKPTSMGVRPRLSSTGSTSVASNSLTLRLTSAIPSSLGFVHVAQQSANAPFQGGTLYAAAPVVAWKGFRAAIDGSASVPVPLSAPMIGQTRYYQAFFRDVLHPDGTRVGMSNGVQAICAP
ncbi:MAG: reprolysin-like metallopeptidase [Planctomycetota bacterium]